MKRALFLILGGIVGASVVILLKAHMEAEYKRCGRLQGSDDDSSWWIGS
ncbi:MAG: hypothetical protein UX72_C0001G0021 [Parcubacteria group bacterium GW2011_GWA2_47_10]|nr:MAG: hypothetical protein UX72_C0001G0021 [Parcubacteria group bacterium GW2011_GWA2_47_10]